MKLTILKCDGNLRRNEINANHGTGIAALERRVKHQLRQCDRRDARLRASLAKRGGV